MDAEFAWPLPSFSPIISSAVSHLHPDTPSHALVCILSPPLSTSLHFRVLIFLTSALFTMCWFVGAEKKENYNKRTHKRLIPIESKRNKGESKIISSSVSTTSDHNVPSTCVFQISWIFYLQDTDA